MKGFAELLTSNFFVINEDFWNLIEDCFSLNI